MPVETHNDQEIQAVYAVVRHLEHKPNVEVQCSNVDEAKAVIVRIKRLTVSLSIKMRNPRKYPLAEKQYLLFSRLSYQIRADGGLVISKKVDLIKVFAQDKPLAPKKISEFIDDDLPELG